MKVKLSALRRLIKKVLKSTYYSDSQADEIADVLLFAEMTGKNTQGVLKLLGTEPMQKVKPKFDPKIVKETKISALIDGGGNPSILACKQATSILIQKCKENGLSLTGEYNTFASSGAIGYYAHEIAKNDFIGIVLAGSPGGVAPFGSIDPLFGTNPMAFGFPTQSEPLIFDMATSAITWYGLVRANALGIKLPDGVAIDNAGNPTTEAKKAMSGAILPFDKSYKGSGLSMVAEILTGPLTGGTFCTTDGNGDWHNTFIAIDPEILVGREAFKKSCSELIEKVRYSRSRNGKKIRIPGEEGFKRKKAIEKSGEIEIEQKLYDDLKQLVKE